MNRILADYIEQEYRPYVKQLGAFMVRWERYMNKALRQLHSEAYTLNAYRGQDWIKRQLKDLQTMYYTSTVAPFNLASAILSVSDLTLDHHRILLSDTSDNRERMKERVHSASKKLLGKPRKDVPTQIQIWLTCEENKRLQSVLLYVTKLDEALTHRDLYCFIDKLKTMIDNPDCDLSQYYCNDVHGDITYTKSLKQNVLTIRLETFTSRLLHRPGSPVDWETHLQSLLNRNE